jgi:hypothetical protein
MILGREGFARFRHYFSPASNAPVNGGVRCILPGSMLSIEVGMVGFGKESLILVQGHNCILSNGWYASEHILRQIAVSAIHCS